MITKNDNSESKFDKFFELALQFHLRNIYKPFFLNSPGADKIITNLKLYNKMKLCFFLSVCLYSYLISNGINRVEFKYLFLMKTFTLSNWQIKGYFINE